MLRNEILLRSGIKQEYSLTTPIQYVVEFLVSAIRQVKQMKGMQAGKKKVKLPLFPNIRNLLELMSMEV